MSAELLDKPTPEQMFELAGVCIGLGKQEGRNRLGISKIPSRYIFFGSDFLIPPDQAYYDFIFGNTTSVSRQLLGKIALLPERAWSMDIKEKGMVFEAGNKVDESQTLHRFKWTGQSVIQASKLTRLVDAEDYGESYQPVYLDRFCFQADLHSAFGQLETVGSGDCQELIEGIRDFRGLLKQAELASQERQAALNEAAATG